LSLIETLYKKAKPSPFEDLVTFTPHGIDALSDGPVIGMAYGAEVGIGVPLVVVNWFIAGDMKRNKSLEE
jgi:hypothetical protein